ncbi:MAG: universal stress protein, partial [Pseudonocardia sp.]|nr:universal stress protein [Pseudonocardia sp.]
MSAYRTIVVGTAGSHTSRAGGPRAAAVAADSSAELVIVCAYTPASRDDTADAEDALKDEAYLVVGWTPA